MFKILFRFGRTPHQELLHKKYFVSNEYGCRYGESIALIQHHFGRRRRGTHAWHKACCS